jgi:glycerol-3-phosphate acyltransferase PlsY
MVTGVLTFIYTLFKQDYMLIMIIGLIVAFVIYRHRANITRILNKTEPKVTFLSGKKK